MFSRDCREPLLSSKDRIQPVLKETLTHLFSKDLLKKVNPKIKKVEKKGVRKKSIRKQTAVW